LQPIYTIRQKLTDVAISSIKQDLSSLNSVISATTGELTDVKTMESEVDLGKINDAIVDSFVPFADRSATIIQNYHDNFDANNTRDDLDLKDISFKIYQFA
jgi:hypothetical protein